MALAYPRLRTVEPLSPYLPENLRRGLVLYLWMNEGSGNRVYDLSGNGNHGTIYGATWTRLASGKNALYFDGVDDRVLVQHSSSLYLSYDFTLLSWIRLEKVHPGWYGVIDKGRNTQTDFWILTNKDQQQILYGTKTDVAFWEVALPAPVKVWMFYAVGYEGTRAFWSVNGASKSYSGYLGSRLISTNPLTLGCRTPSSDYSNVSIGTVLIYNRALSDAEIRALYDLHRGLFVG
ncbi:MAG: LamG domain-containing protein [Thermoprotei archaeon]